MALADRISALARQNSRPLAVRGEHSRALAVREAESRYSADQWLTEYLFPAMEQFGYGGRYGLNMTHQGINIHEVANTLPGYTQALRACPPAFAAQLVRALVMSQARFTFRTRLSSGKPKRTFGTAALSVLERPWPKATTGELIARMEWHAGLAGNSYVTNRTPGRLRVLRPDWVAIVYGSDQEPEQAAYALDGEVIGYVYAIGGLISSGEALSPVAGNRMYTLLPDEVAHWSPIPDPEGSGIGMSWLTPAIKDMQADRAGTETKLRFFANGATPNLVVKGLQAATREKFLEIVEMLEERHTGIANAFRTLYLTEGADATVVGSNFAEMDLKNIQGASETRISSLSRVPASLLGIAEGLAGSSLNAGNFGMARRIFADTWVYPSLQDLSASLAPMVRVPDDADLWHDTTDIPLLREDGKDAAEIEDIKATTITKYVREGFTAESAVAAVIAQDVGLLKHTGKVSVQLQEPGAQPPGPAAPTAGPAPKPKPKPTSPAGTRRAEVRAQRGGGARRSRGGYTAALATLNMLRGRLSGALLRELDAIIAQLAGIAAGKSPAVRHTPGTPPHPHNQQDHAGKGRTGVLGSVLDKLDSLRDKLSDDDRSVLERAMAQLRDLESSDVDDDDLVEDEPDEEDEDEEEEEEEEENDLTMESASGDVAFTPYLDGQIDVDWDEGSFRLSPQSAREVADAVAKFKTLPIYPGRPDPPEPPDWVTDRKTWQQWLNEFWQQWDESEAGQKYGGVTGEATTSDGELKVARFGSGATWIGDPESVDADESEGVLSLDDPDEASQFAEMLRQAIARAAPEPQRSRAPAAVLDSFAVDVARRRPQVGRGKAAPGGARNADPDDDWRVEVLLTAMAEFAGETDDDERAWTPAQAEKHQRWPKGHPLAGKFRPMVDVLIEALTAHRDSGGKGDPFKGFDREPLRKAAGKRGITVPRGASRDEIVKLLVADLGGGAKPKKAAKAPPPLKKAAVPRPRKPKPLTPAQELAQWKADAAKPGRVPAANTGPTKREYYVSSWEEGIARIRKEIADAEKDGRHDRLPQLQKDLAYQTKMRDHWRDNPDPELEEPVHGPTFALAQKVDRSRPLAVYGNILHMEGSDDAWLHLNMTELAQVPAELHAVVGAHMAARADGGIWIGDTAVSRMDHSHDLSGETPRGWGDGHTFDDVNGVYRPDRRTMLVGRTANSEHRGAKTASHEFGHALDAALGDPSREADWEAVHKKALADFVSPYYRQEGHAGRQEFWAEALSTWVTARQQRNGSDSRAKYILRLGVKGETADLIHEYFNRLAAKWGVQ